MDTSTWVIGTLPCSRTGKDQRDSREELLQRRGDQLANFAPCQLFDEISSTTASIIDSAYYYIALVTIQNKLMNEEACSVPSAHLHSHLPTNDKGNNYVKLLSLTMHAAIGTDPSAEPDEDYFTHLQKAQCNKLIEQDERWHEYKKVNPKASSRTRKPTNNDTTLLMRKCANGNKDGCTIATTIALDFPTEEYFIRISCKTLSGGTATKKKFRPSYSVRRGKSPTAQA